MIVLILRQLMWCPATHEMSRSILRTGISMYTPFSHSIRHEHIAFDSTVALVISLPLA